MTSYMFIALNDDNSKIRLQSRYQRVVIFIYYLHLSSYEILYDGMFHALNFIMYIVGRIGYSLIYIFEYSFLQSFSLVSPVQQRYFLCLGFILEVFLLLKVCFLIMHEHEFVNITLLEAFVVKLNCFFYSNWKSPSLEFEFKFACFSLIS